MSALSDELKAFCSKTHDDVWKRRAGQKVPSASDITFGTDAVTLDGTVLYADLADSTGLVRNYPDWFAAEVYKNYLHCATKVIKSMGGEVTAFDGDRVMAVFIGTDKNTKAAKCGLKINWAVINVIQPAIKAKYPDKSFQLRQKVGVDTSSLFAAKTGIRGSNDLVWVGNAANNAAKMAALSTSHSTYISAATYDSMHESSRVGGAPQRNMWTDLGTGALGYRIYGSTWWWSF